MWWNLPHGAKEWCIRFIIFLIYLKIGEEQNMLNNNVTRNKMCTISCKHKGVIDLICKSQRTQNHIDPRGVVKQMKK